jgi:hypothetical protein
MLGLTDVRKPETQFPRIEVLLGHHEYSKEMEEIIENLESFLFHSDSGCEQIDTAVNDKDLIQNRLSVLGSTNLVFVLEKYTAQEALRKIKDNITADLDRIESETLEYINEKIREFEIEYEKEKTATIEEE